MFGVGRPDKQPADDGSQESGESGSTSESTGKPAGRADRMFGLNPKVLGLGAVAVAVALTGGAFALISSSGNGSNHPTAQVQPASGPISAARWQIACTSVCARGLSPRSDKNNSDRDFRATGMGSPISVAPARRLNTSVNSPTTAYMKSYKKHRHASLNPINSCPVSIR